MRSLAFVCLVFMVGCTPNALTQGTGDVTVTGHRLDERSLHSDVSTLSVSPTFETDYPDKVEPNGVLALEQALALALLHNRQLEAAAWEVRAREAAQLQSSLRPNPVLGFKVENFGGGGALSEFDSSVSTLRLSQAIELGDKRVKRTRLAQQERALSTWDYEAQRLDVIAQTGQRFIDVLAAQRQVELAQQNVALGEDLLAIVTDRIDQGLAPGAERDKALVQVNALKIELTQQRHQLTAQRQQLAAMWDSQSATYREVVGHLQDLVPVPSYEQTAQQIERSPALARWSAEIAQRRAAVDLSDAHTLGNLTIGAGVRQFNASDERAVVFELGIPLPLSNRNQGARRQARYRLEKAVAAQRHAETQVRTTLMQKLQDLGAAHYAAQTLIEQSIPAAQAAYEAARQTFAQGVTDYLDVLDAQRTLIATQYRAVETLATFHKILMDIESFIGVPLNRSSEQTAHNSGEHNNQGAD